MAGSYIRVDGTNMEISRDGALSLGYQAISLGSGGSTSLSDAQQATSTIEFTGTLTANATVNFDLKPGACYTIINSCASASPGFNVTVRVTGQTGVVVENGKTIYVSCDDTDLVIVGTDPIAMGVGLANGKAAIAMSDANTNVTRAQAMCGKWIVTGTLTASRNLILPDLTVRFFHVTNSGTGQSVQVIGSSGTGVVVANNKGAWLYCDGTNVVPVSGLDSAMASAGTALTNSTAETVLGSFAIGAGLINAGTIVRIRFQGIAPSTNSTDTLTIRLRFGTTTLVGTALITTSAIDVANNNIFLGYFELTGRAAAGASSAIVGSGHYIDPGAAGGNLKSAYLASTNFATNGVLLIEVTGQWSVASASNSCRLDQLNIEIR